MSEQSKKFFKKNAVYNGTILLNPVQLMDAYAVEYHNKRLDKITPKNETTSFAIWYSGMEKETVIKDFKRYLKEK